MGRNAAVGRYGEDVAVRHLVELGMQVLDRNWRCPAGELDIVVRDGATVVACEVKTRSSLRFGSGLEAVSAAKRARLWRLARCWRDAHPDQVPPGAPLRIDVVAVHPARNGSARVEHVRGAA